MIRDDKFSRVDALFDEALDHAPAERLKFVAERCQGDASLEREVRKLLELSDEDDALFPSGAMKGPLWDEVAAELERGVPGAEPDLGSHIGDYEIVELLGRGGMGAVYRAKDPALGRDVAVKALSTAFASDETTLRRFEREAKVLASLNHPNIAAIYDLLHVDDKRYLILEVVEGETLWERFRRGPLELPELLRVAEQIADALVEAHRKGIIHRDLKPSNIKLTADGRVKVLDFGLAKSPDPVAKARSGREKPDAAAPTTEVGVVLGTPGYMSPEQARGDAVDRRSDIWAFGCLLYEMLTGERAFAGETTSDTLAAVLRDEVDWSRLPPGTPVQLERLVGRCLDRNPRQRLQDIGDARIEIREVAEAAKGRSPVQMATRSTRLWILLAAMTAFFAGMAVYRALGVSEVESEAGGITSRTTVALGPEERLWVGASSSVAVSPDGERLALVAERDGRTRLFLRALDGYELTPVRGSDGAREPFFSPDGSWVAFFVGGSLRRVSLSGDLSETIAEAGLQPRGASWAADDTIVFAQDDAAGLLTVSAIGGEPRPLTSIEPGERVEHLWPSWLPGQDAVLFTRRSANGPNTLDELALLRVATGEVEILGEGAQPTYLPSGHLVYVRGSGLEVAPFDVGRGVLGAGTRVVDSVRTYPVGSTLYAASAAGTLVYLEPSESTEVRVVGEEGSSRVDLPPGTPGWPRIAPDGRRAAVQIGAGDGREIWIVDLEDSASPRQLTTRGGGFPVWSPDGERLVFMSRRAGTGDLYVVPADGSREPELVLGGRTRIPVAWSDSGLLAFYQLEEETERDIWVVDLEGGGEPQPFVRTPANELSPAFSPDGRHIAYVSNETGRNEVYVRPYPTAGPVVPISDDGGSEPVWSEDGRLLYFRQGGNLYVVTITWGDELRAGRPEPRLALAELPGAGGNPAYDLFRGSGGLRVLALQPTPGASIDKLRIVQRWDRELRSAGNAP